MPELPEVEVVRAGLAPAVVGSTITAVSVFDERALTRHAAGAADFVSRLEGRSFAAASRRGKFLWLPLDDAESALIAHLGMSGQMLLRAPGAEAERHERVRIGIEHPSHGELAVVFADQRTFGSLAVDALVEDGDSLVPSQVRHIARDPLDDAFDDRAFLASLSRRRSAIKRVLLDQGLVSGIGNIYADESLWAARIHPETSADKLSTVSASRVLAEVRLVLTKALAEGGTSFDAQYVNVNGQAGYFAHSLNAYGRGGQPCPRCGTPITRVAFMNRSSHFCPRCQRRR
ncbi:MULTISPECIES: bifunctional DNA-formamidopyrimidine glycosylase/DNA-(apurinic or apyrimidinic site) lyase [unclassified Microbacterium]|uniref:bifunctional DNA-formamidopyrimidine glycosylase/DNA-(apurinic or apyrimidinic site) lyase n=1 Tax=unclassified Microbacterium TaxID=2609290 RepID=UPI001604E5E8|nr:MULTISPECIES: bifunctional DNA-formamidopyrimidine glycosylase/DNA-(apurinic or apyrimidinic site) lyase [unclassified Microbacterium]QNA92516.1 bifunctional DNA-formamidopyrimidine glycosylase/DNA-(apurinic or apyrimidinic site) lyase [Microbacterium sp. Se63.02b]QYM65813.1 bifunctional DNA-formamidopyrimidine glycosylase/DNA-(apurinic or apyrimidinic site) lyase [Microbacterium sp. Se5.02b]